MFYTRSLQDLKKNEGVGAGEIAQRLRAGAVCMEIVLLVAQAGLEFTEPHLLLPPKC